MIFTRTNLSYLPILLIIIYAFFINWISANVGVMPVDTFGFFDTGYSILKNKLPIRDFWAFSGIVIDYFQAFFFLIFGESWKSYIFHSSFINVFASLSFYIFLINLKLNKIYSLLYTLSFATLCYPVSGTPFSYNHSYVFSLICIFLLCVGIKNKNPFSWFALPIVCFLAFFSMQTPSSYIFIVILIFSIYFFFNKKNHKNLKIFFLSSLGVFLFLLFYLIFTNTPFENFLYQYFLFPMTIGSERLGSNLSAYVTLSEQLNFNRLIGDFKYIHIFYLPLIFLTIKLFLKREKNFLKITNLIIILSVFAFLFNQLVTANQIFIFSLIPLIAAILHLNLEETKFKNIFLYSIILILCFITIKYHHRYNIERKFHDLENVDKSKAIDAEIISKKMKHLKWVTPHSEFTDPKKELKIIQEVIDTLKLDTRNKTIVTNYQFFSVVLGEDLNLLNRWYLWGNDTHPTKGHKYFNFYKKMINENIEKNNIKVIYLLGQHNEEIVFKDIEQYFTDKCFNSKTLIEGIFSHHEIIGCKN